MFDPLDVWRVLRADDDEERGALLEHLAYVGEAERRIGEELADLRPLADPEAFVRAHRETIRAIEVLDRNGPATAALPRLGVASRVVRPVVFLFTRWIVRGHRDTLIGEMREVYTTREASAVYLSREHRLLRRARRDVQLVEETMKGNRFAIPTFLVGGALLTTFFSIVRNLLGSALDRLGVVVVPLVLAALVAGVAWCALYAAGVAHRRIRLSTQQPAAELWQAIGNAGPPPDDRSYPLAIVAILITLLAWIAIPLLTWIVF